MNTTNPIDETEPFTWRRLRQLYKEWLQDQSRTRIVLFWAGYIAVDVLAGVFTWAWTHHRNKPTGVDCLCLGLGGLLFFIVWPLVIFRWKRFKWNDHKINAPKLVLWAVLTLWLSFFAAAANAGQTNTFAANAPAIHQSANIVTSADATKPQVIDCLWEWIFVLIILGIFFAFFIWVLCAAHFINCGNANNPPPQAPNNGNGDNIIIKSALANVNTNIPLPSTVFYLVNGEVVSNSAGLSMTSLPSMLNVDGVPVPNGAQISPTVPGISIQPAIGLWTETGNYADATFDPAHPYVGIFNFSLLTSTNLLNWQEACTVIGWFNANQSVPLVCTITYTNGVPVTTNWTQIYLNGFMQPTNIVVYGQLLSVSTNLVPLVHPADSGPPTPGGGGGSDGSTNSVSTNVSAQFYRLVCNTNDIVTSWP